MGWDGGLWDGTMCAEELIYNLHILNQDLLSVIIFANSTMFRCLSFVVCRDCV